MVIPDRSNSLFAIPLVGLALAACVGGPPAEDGGVVDPGPALLDCVDRTSARIDDSGWLHGYARGRAYFRTATGQASSYDLRTGTLLDAPVSELLRSEPGGLWAANPLPPDVWRHRLYVIPDSTALVRVLSDDASGEAPAFSTEAVFYVDVNGAIHGAADAGDIVVAMADRTSTIAVSAAGLYFTVPADGGQELIFKGTPMAASAPTSLGPLGRPSRLLSMGTAVGWGEGEALWTVGSGTPRKVSSLPGRVKEGRSIAFFAGVAAGVVHSDSEGDLVVLAPLDGGAVQRVGVAPYIATVEADEGVFLWFEQQYEDAPGGLLHCVRP